ncbi:MAG: NeuD/PglB/VioB family sugar acetyltransferase [Alphaproteobacteria bacterium]|nr:NeuD/PglB/VioB family sugar acetyltransferase [Alphaproteobacteria bacterium]
MMQGKCVILGGGGHAKVLIECMRTQDGIQPDGILEQDETLVGKTVLGVKIMGCDDMLEDLKEAGYDTFVVGVGQIRATPFRKVLFDKAVSSGLTPLTVRHGSAIVSPTALVEDGAQLLPGCIVNAQARIGRGGVINTHAVVEHDCEIGEFAFVAPNATVLGAAIIAPGAFVGAGAVVFQGVRVGENAVVAAGAVVRHDIPAGGLAVGVPATIKSRPVE